jgi:hypothetical protein
MLDLYPGLSTTPVVPDGCPKKNCIEGSCMLCITIRTMRKTRAHLLALGICAVPVLFACGGGSATSGSSSAVAATNSAGSSASASSGLGTTSALPAHAPPASLVALPTFHMAPIAPPPPSDLDVGGTNASASMPPKTFAMDAAVARIDTARLTPESLAAQLHALRTQDGAGAAAPSGAAAPASTTVYTPAQIRAAYNLPALPPTGASLTAAAAAALGAGQTIYVVDAYDDPNAFTDLNTFSTTFGLPTCTRVTVSASTALPLAYPGAGCQFVVAYSNAAGTINATAPAYSSGWSPEISLDVQWSHAIAPLARIVLLESASDSLNDLLGSVLLANQMGPGVVSMSFGAAEGSWVPSADSYFAAPGMSYLASTGDAGSQVNWPAVSNNVLAVGGTSLSFSGTGSRSETAWSDTGGGISAYESLPAYQSGVSIDGGGPLHSRAVADVSFNADPNTGQYVVISAPGGTAAWYIYGGTSISSPQWAGVLALVNAARTSSGLALLGDAHPSLYAQVAEVPGNYAAAFDDITSGSDGSCATCKAGVGYDQATGWGTPNYSNLLALLSSVSNLPPLPSATMPTGMAGVAYSVQWPATDSARGALSYTLAGAPSGLALGYGDTVSWANPVAGTYTFSVTVQNAAGKTARGTESLTISPTPAAPTVPGGHIIAKTGVALSQTLGVTAPASSGTLTYSLSGAPSGLAVSASGVLTWAKTVQGSYTFTATATNSYGKTGAGVYSLTVIAESPPVFSGSTTLSGVAGIAFAAGISAIDPNGGSLSFSIAGAPSALAITSSGTLSWAKPVAGIYPLLITATDSFGYASAAAYKLSIAGPPVLAGGSYTGNTTAAFSASVSATDPIGSALSYSMTGAPSGLTISSTGALSWPKPVKGSYVLTVTAKDSAGLSGSGKYTLSIYGQPVLASASLVGYTSTAFATSVSASDPNGSSLSYSMTGAPTGLSLSSTGVLSWAKPVLGVYKLTITVKDALGIGASAGDTLTILGPPVLAAGNLTASDAAAISAKVSATDPNGSALSYSMTGAPSGLGISTAGLLTWAKPVKGSYTLTIGAKDALGLSATAKYTLTVS